MRPRAADRDALVFRPCPDIVAAFAARCAPYRPAALPPAGLTGMLDERREFLAQRGGVLLVQVDLVIGAVDLEAHCLIRWPPVEIIFECDGYLRCHPASTPLLRASTLACAASATCRSTRTHNWARPPQRPYVG